LFWNSFEMPKKSVVASLVGNFSPVNRSTAILVRRVRHLRGEIGDELNNLAAERPWSEWGRQNGVWSVARLTILENRCAVQLDHDLIRIFILFDVTHFGEAGH
jgi:hypothetical protein